MGWDPIKNRHIQNQQSLNFSEKDGRCHHKIDIILETNFKDFKVNIIKSSSKQLEHSKM